MFSRESATHKGIDNSHLGQWDSQSAAHITPRDIGALLGTLKKNPTRGIHFGKTGVRLYKTHSHTLGTKCLLPYIVCLFKTTLHISKIEI